MSIGNMYEMLSSFKLAKFTAIFEVGDRGLDLPEYKGSTIRGAFGHVFKQVACKCTGEDHDSDCIYAYIFDTKPRQDSQILRNYESVPRPFLFETIYDSRKYFPPGERISFSFTLIGKGLDYLPYFIYSLQEMAKIGLGKSNKPLVLRQIFQVSVQQDLEQLIYDGKEQRIYNRWQPLSGDEIIKNANINLSNKEIWIHFLSPTRIKSKGNYLTTAPNFDDLLKSIIRRFSSIIYFHQGLQLEMDFKDYFAQAAQVRLLKEDSRWIDWERYSNRQHDKIKLGGLVGKALYKADIESFFHG